MARKKNMKKKSKSEEKVEVTNVNTDKEQKKNSDVTLSNIESDDKKPTKKNKKYEYKNNNNDKYVKNYTSQRIKKPSVNNQIKELHGYFFDCTGYKQAEEYKRTKEAIQSYVTTTFTMGTDVQKSIDEMKEVVIPSYDKKRFTNESLKDNYILQEEFKIIMKEHHSKTTTLKENLRTTYRIVWDLCTDALKENLKGLDEFDKREQSRDVIWLLEEIRKMMYNFQDKRYLEHNIFSA